MKLKPKDTKIEKEFMKAKRDYAQYDPSGPEKSMRQLRVAAITMRPPAPLHGFFGGDDVLAICAVAKKRDWLAYQMCRHEVTYG